MAKQYDFGGYATRNDLLCTDGRTIRHGAFKDCDGMKVPLVYQHVHNDPTNVIGHALLENRDDGVYAYCSLNNTETGRHAKEMVEHGDLSSLSIYANQLKQRGGDVLHGMIREVSLVMTGANPGAYIDNLSIVHSDGGAEMLEDEAIITTGYEISLGGGEMAEERLMHADEDGSDETVADIFDSLSDKQKDVVYYMIGKALEDAGDGEAEHSGMGGYMMKYNVFDPEDAVQEGGTLTHAEFLDIVEDAKRCGSLKEAFLAHAEEYDLPNGVPGIDYGVANLELLFPEYRNVREQPDVIKRDDAWVASIISGANKTPFSRIKTMTIDITADVARARGYRKGHLKKEEVVKMAKRVTGPTTIYKKQRLDRDDIIDVTSMDIVAWLKSEMQMMLREELARAILIGDGRDISDEDKIDEACIRPILSEEELYAFKEYVVLNQEGKYTGEEYVKFVDQVALAMTDYRGSGSPKLYTSPRHHIRLKQTRNVLGAKMFESDASLADAMGVKGIVDVPFFDELKDPETGRPVLGIIVDMKDYTIGTNRGGETTFFDDFDIDYNQYKYLYETRLSGALTRPDCAIILVQSDTPEVMLEVKPVAPSVTAVGSVTADKLQDKVKISDSGNIGGVLHYVTDFEDFEGDDGPKEGNFLALRFSNSGSDSDAEIKVRITDGMKKQSVKVNNNGTYVFRVTDEMKQRIRVDVVGESGKVETKTFGLSGLTLESEKHATSLSE